MPELPWSDDLELTVQPVSAFFARDFVRHRLLAHGMAHLADDVALVVSELATNALVHAQTPFKVSLQASEQTLLLNPNETRPRRCASARHWRQGPDHRGTAQP